MLKNRNKVNDAVVAYFHYNNLTIKKIISSTDDGLYLLYEKCERVQCESDSSYEESEASEDSEETTVTKIKNICYMTRIDLETFLNRLLQK